MSFTPDIGERRFVCVFTNAEGLIGVQELEVVPRPGGELLSVSGGDPQVFVREVGGGNAFSVNAGWWWIATYETPTKAIDGIERSGTLTEETRRTQLPALRARYRTAPATNIHRYFLDRDHSGHWYQVPVDQRAAWEAWSDLDETDEASWDAPTFAVRLRGSPSRIEFSDPREE